MSWEVFSPLPFFWKRLHRSLISSLNICLNLPMKLSKPGDYFCRRKVLNANPIYLVIVRLGYLFYLE
jgi:hypothetical protein